MGGSGRPQGEALSVRIEDFEALRAGCSASFETAGALRMLAELNDLSSRIAAPHSEAVETTVQSTFRSLPSMLRLLADGIEARAQAHLDLLQAIQEAQRPSHLPGAED